MIVSVHRSGGFAGLQAHGEVDTRRVPDGDRIAQVAVRLVDRPPGSGIPEPDRYVYRIRITDRYDAQPGDGGPPDDGVRDEVSEVTVAEQDLDVDGAWLVDRVLASGPVVSE